MDFQEMGIGFMDWIDLARNRDRFLAFVNKVINFGLRKMWENS